jgi:hypothetical protein
VLNLVEFLSVRIILLRVTQGFLNSLSLLFLSSSSLVQRRVREFPVLGFFLFFSKEEEFVNF